MSQLSTPSTPSPQRIRAASDASLWDSDNVDPFDAYAAQQEAELERRRVSDILSQFAVAPAGAGTGATAATPSARPAGVGTASSPRRSASSAASISPPPATVRMANTTRRLIMHQIVNAPSMSRTEEMRLRQRYNITDQDLDDYVAGLPPPAAATPAATAAAPGGSPPSPPPSASPSTPRSSPASRGRGRRRPNIRRRPGPVNRRDQDGMRRQLDLLAEDARQQARNRRIRNITHTNTVNTVYEDNGEPPTVRRTSSRVSNP